MERGFTVQVVMTPAAEQFIRPLTFAALTGHKVLTNLFSAASAEDTLSSAIEHIRVAQENRHPGDRAGHGRSARQVRRTASRTIF